MWRRYCGVEVGLYKYFAEFRQKVALYVDQKLLTGTMPTLLQHLDCDGSWSVSDCRALISELTEIKAVFQKEPPSKEIQNLKENVSKFFGITPKNLFECFVDTDCEFLIDRLLERGSYIRQSAGTSGKYYYDCCYGTGTVDF